MPRSYKKRISNKPRKIVKSVCFNPSDVERAQELGLKISVAAQSGLTHAIIEAELKASRQANKSLRYAF